MSPSDSNLIILFDGACNLCNAWVDFILNRDPAGKFRFAALQSDAGRNLLARYSRSAEDLDTVFLIEGGACYDKSTAVLRITRQLGGVCLVMYAFIAVPRPIRDAVYTFIARRRYQWFGKRDTCRTPTAGESERFIVDSEGGRR
ncbi:MAG: DUF393 domain-containing protein [Candidatus Hydrogenedentes bacterium]|nr:DUF393 domain-containing protein [Candidatus Hydrogenedentota bacterium]